MKYKPGDLVWMYMRLPYPNGPASWEKGVVERILPDLAYACRYEATGTFWRGTSESLRPRLQPDRFTKLTGTSKGRDHDSLADTLIDIARSQNLNEQELEKALKEYLGY